MNSNFFRKIMILMFLMVGCILSAQTGTHPIETALAGKYGPIMCKDLEGSFEFTVSADFTEISNILDTANALQWYVNFASISSRDDGKAAMIFRVNQHKNDAASKFATLQSIVQPGMLVWKSAQIPEDMAVVTTIETNFDQKIIINGVTKRSGLVFSHLFPMLERASALQNPFFARGTYSDTDQGRVMNFAINCDW